MDETKQMSGYPASKLNETRGGHSLYPPYVPRLGTEAEETVGSCPREAAFNCTLSVISILFCAVWTGTREKNLVTQPKVHPESMRHFQDNKNYDRTSNTQMLKTDNLHQIIHDMMAKDRKENQDLIQEIRDNLNKENID
jgi:hypothetical protein